MSVNIKYKNFPYNLLKTLHFKYGRRKGKITVRHKGGGIKYLYTNIDFNYLNNNSSLAVVLKLYVDFNRNALPLLILFINGDFKGLKKLILSTYNLNLGELISFNRQFPLKIGSVRYLFDFYIGMFVHSLGLKPFGKSVVARSLGTKIKILFKELKYICVKFPSGVFKLVHKNCIAILGQNSIIRIKKEKKLAGHRILLNKRPTVRGSAMNPVDHPHGGGCGRTSIGLRSSKTPWGKFHHGIKTRSRKNYILIN